MKIKTKVNQPRIKGQYTYRSKFSLAWSYFYRMFLITTGSLFTASILIAVGIAWATPTPVAKAQDKVVVKQTRAAILERIASCESGDGTPGSSHQFDKKGKVVKHQNTNGTYDIGRYQINSIHLALAMQQGFNLFTDEGNTAFAEWMWINKGTGDWDSSAHCWRR